MSETYSSHKYSDNPVAEALDMDVYGYADETTGSVEAYGHFALFIVESPFDVDVPNVGKVTVPVGNYILSTGDQGFVYLQEYDDADSARAAFAGAEKVYGEWLELNE